MSILEIIAQDFESRKSGFVLGISSVAVDRGRQSNYIYGSAKSGFTTYLSGLRSLLYGSGVRVVTIRPGSVKTKMTTEQDFPSVLQAKPEEIANDIYSALHRNVRYTPSIWRLIMAGLKIIPEFLFKRLNL